MKKIISILLAAVMVMALLAGCGSKNSGNTNDNNTPNNNQTTELSGSVATNGSTSMDKVIGALREQFMTDHKNVTVTYDPTGSGSGIEAVKNGTADIGLASRSLKDEEKADGLTETVIALDGIAVIVNAQNKVADLTVEQIAKIFTGEITDWSQVGGDPGTISCIGRESGSGTRDGFESITGTKDSCKLDQELTSTGGVIEAVAGNPNAIGYASLSAVEGKDTVKAVTVEQQGQDNTGVSAGAPQQGAGGDLGGLAHRGGLALFQLRRSGLDGKAHIGAGIAVRHGEYVQVVDGLLFTGDTGGAEGDHLLEGAAADFFCHALASPPTDVHQTVMESTKTFTSRTSTPVFLVTTYLTSPIMERHTVAIFTPFSTMMCSSMDTVPSSL